jgi:hypothetical protein
LVSGVTMSDDLITLRLVGLGTDGREIAFESFTNQLNSYYDLISQFDRVINGAQSYNLKIVSISMASPLSLAVRPEVRTGKTPKTNPSVFAQKLRAQLHVLDEGPIPDNVDRKLIEIYSKFTQTLGIEFESIDISSQGETVLITKPFISSSNDLAMPACKALGSIAGIVTEAHYTSDPPFIIIDPFSLPIARIKGVFSEKQLDEIRTAGKRKVLIQGELTYVENAPYPKEIRIDTIHVLPNDYEQIDITEFEGVEPGLASDENIERMKDAWKDMVLG